MSTHILSALEKLLSVIRKENIALSEARIPDALAFLPEKQSAATELEQAVEAASAKECHSAEEDRPSHQRAILTELLDLGEQNSQLLQRAITAQKRVIELLTTPLEEDLPQNYGQHGTYATEHHPKRTYFISQV